MSNIKTFPNMKAIKDEAAVWVVRVHGYTYKTDESMPEDKVQELQAWMSQSPAHRDSFLEMLSGWDAMHVLEDLADILPYADLYQRPKKSLLPKLAFDFGGKAFFAAWSGAAAACFAILIWSFVSVSPSSIEFTTEKGQQVSHLLEDGSRITLNTDTEISVNFSDARRVVTLVKGEASFDVAKDTDRPFVVYAGDGMVWAVGTAFNVDFREDYVDVIVSEGTVKVFSGVTLRDEEPLLLIDGNSGSGGLEGSNLDDGAYIEYFRELVLEAGESAQYSQSRVSKELVEQQELAQGLAWQEGVLIFQGETLEQALNEISRYTDRNLVIIDPAIRQASVGGRFKTDDIEELVSSLALGLDIKMEQGEGDSILFSAK